MAVTEPYSALWTALKTALVNAAGPFTKSDQVDYWPGEGEGPLGVSDEMRQRLTQTGRSPVALFVDLSSELGLEPGGIAITEDWLFAVYYGCRVPGAAGYETAFTGDGTQYWGEFPTRQWIYEKLVHQNKPGSGTTWPIQFLRRRPVAVNQIGVVVCALDLKVQNIVAKAT